MSEFKVGDKVRHTAGYDGVIVEEGSHSSCMVAVTSVVAGSDPEGWGWDKDNKVVTANHSFLTIINDECAKCEECKHDFEKKKAFYENGSPWMVSFDGRTTFYSYDPENRQYLIDALNHYHENVKRFGE